jgi:acyl-coenzyme A thioesterase PaaI-like protein
VKVLKAIVAAGRARLPLFGFREMTPRELRRTVNYWPPFRFAGIRVLSLDDEWREVRVVLRLRPWNRNYVGTHFGGSLFAMADPFWMLLMMNRLGRDYVVWDRAGEIDFVSPGRGDVFAHFVLDDDRVAAVKAAADAHPKHIEWFGVDIVSADGSVVARVRKQLYVRRKSARPNG